MSKKLKLFPVKNAGAALFIASSLLLSTGCGGSDNFVATGFPVDGGNTVVNNNANSSMVTFNFVKMQAPIEVPGDTVSIKFEFFTETEAEVEADVERLLVALLNDTRPFAQSITFEAVPLSVNAVRITALGAGGAPLARYTAGLTLEANGELVVTPADLNGGFLQLSSLDITRNFYYVQDANSPVFDLEVAGIMDDGTVFNVNGDTSEPLVFFSNNTAIAEVDQQGRVTIVGSGGDQQESVAITVQAGVADVEARGFTTFLVSPPREFEGEGFLAQLFAAFLGAGARPSADRLDVSWGTTSLQVDPSTDMFESPGPNQGFYSENPSTGFYEFEGDEYFENVDTTFSASDPNVIVSTDTGQLNESYIGTLEPGTTFTITASYDGEFGTDTRDVLFTVIDSRDLSTPEISAPDAGGTLYVNLLNEVNFEGGFGIFVTLFEALREGQVPVVRGTNEIERSFFDVEFNEQEEELTNLSFAPVPGADNSSTIAINETTGVVTVAENAPTGATATFQVIYNPAEGEVYRDIFTVVVVTETDGPGPGPGPGPLLRN